jgi:uridine kinase
LKDALTSLIASLPLPHPVRVAVDGIDAAGKTTLADELGRRISAAGRPVIRATLDHFHRPRSDRYQRGFDSPEGYYYDSFDYPALCENLLIPLGPGGSLRYHRQVFDFQRDLRVHTDEEIAPSNAILLFDGVFLMRPELNNHWDLRIFIQVDFHTALRRACERDLDLLGGEAAVKARYQTRYFPAQRLYLESVMPDQIADIVLESID